MTLITAMTIPPPLFATRGPDDYGLFIISGFIALIAATAISAIIYFALTFWARQSRRPEGRYWLTLLGCVIGTMLTIALVRLAPLDSNDLSSTSVPAWVIIGLPILGAIAGFFTWRRRPAADGSESN